MESEPGIFEAVRNGDIEYVEKLKKNSDELNLRNYDGDTPLICLFAYKYSSNYFDIAKELIRKGCDVNIQNKFKMSVLHYAVRNGLITRVRFLIENGAEVNTATCKGETPLFIAVQNGKIDLAKMLLENGADVNIHNERKHSVLNYALSHRKLFNLLLAYGADVNTIDEYGRSLLLHAVQSRNTKDVKFLIGKGCDINIVDDFNQTALSLSLESLCGPHETVLIHRPCCNMRHPLLPDFLLDNGADPNITSSVLKHTNFPCKPDSIHMKLVLKLIHHGFKTDNFPSHTTYPGLLCKLLMARHFSFQNINIKYMDMIYLIGSCCQSRLFSLLYDPWMSQRLENDPEKRKWLQDKCRFPLTLQNITRMIVFRNLRPNKIESIEKLCIPQAVQEFLKFSEYQCHDHMNTSK